MGVPSEEEGGRWTLADPGLSVVVKSPAAPHPLGRHSLTPLGKWPPKKATGDSQYSPSTGASLRGS